MPDVEINVDIRSLLDFATFDYMNNIFLVNGSKNTVEDLGLWKVVVEVTFLDEKGRKQTFSNFFYLHIIERPD